MNAAKAFTAGLRTPGTRATEIDGGGLDYHAKSTTVR